MFPYSLIGQTQQMPISIPSGNVASTSKTAPSPEFTDEHFGTTDANGIKPFNSNAQDFASNWLKGQQSQSSTNTGDFAKDMLHSYGNSLLSGGGSSALLGSLIGFL